MPPFDVSTQTGLIISQIEDMVNLKFEKLNLVDFAPLTPEGKLRYPSNEEILNNFPKLLDTFSNELPNLIILLGNLVTKAFSQNLNLEKLDTKVFKFRQNTIISVYHPSYISVYKKSMIEEYKKEVSGLIKKYF